MRGEVLNRQSTSQATTLAGASLAAAAIAIGIAQIELSGEPQPHIWSNVWLLAALCLAGAGLIVAVFFFVMSMFAHEESASVDAVAGTAEAGESPDWENPFQDLEGRESADQARAATAFRRQHLSRMRGRLAVPAGSHAPPRTAGPVFTGRWHHTSDGFKASPLMNMASLSMPGFTVARGQEPQMRIGVAVACDPIPSDASSSLTGAKLMNFLRSDPVSGLIKSVIHTDEGLAWTRHAGNGALSLEAVLNPAGEGGRAVASALLQPPVTGLRLYGRAEHIACLWLHIDPRGKDGSATIPTGLAGWYRNFLLSIAVTGAFADFLTKDLGLRTYGEPAARAGVMLQTIGPISELVDSDGLSPLPGGFSANQFLGYAIADQAGSPAERVALELLRQVCDHTLHLDDFEGVLESIIATGTTTE